MTSDPVERRLVAIVSADVAGYSQLMSADEVETVRTLTAYRAEMSSIVDAHGGRVVDSPGDNILMEFSSATSALQAAVEMQSVLRDHNSQLPSDRRLEFRMGVHLGEVLVEGGRIYGDGVNMAARLESISEPGGIAASKVVRDQVNTKTEAVFVDLGERRVKSFSEPIRVYAIQTERLGSKATVTVGVAGLEGLLESDEQGTLAALEAHQLASEGVAFSHGGRSLGTARGMARYEFPSARDAVAAALEAQALMAQRNMTIPAARRMSYQMGIDVSEASNPERAVKITKASDPGGIAVTEPIHRQVAAMIDVTFGKEAPDDGELVLWTLPAPTPSQPESGSGPASLLVLPFQRLGSDPNQDYLVDGITDDVTTALSEYGEQRVVPRGSAFAYRGSGLSDRDIARRLDASYVLKGTVRATDNRVRVSAEVVDAESGHAIWTGRFDREYEDILDLQDDIALSITTNLAPFVRQHEVQRSLGRTDSVESWDLMQRGKWHYYRTTREDFDRAIHLYERALEADATNAEAHSWLCLVLLTRAWHGWSPDVAGDMESVHDHAVEGIRLDPRNWRAHDALATYLMFQTRDFDRAIAEAEYGAKFEPGVLGAALQRAGEHERAIELFMLDLSINPYRPDRYHWTTNLAQGHYLLGNYSAALAWAERTLELNDSYIQAIGFRAASLAQLGRLDEARLAMEQFLDHFPGLTAERYRSRFNFKNPSDTDHYLDGLIKAGLPAE